jgi:1-acyl-sn-glycerol-3-phosphate acyltransferase
MPFKPHAQSILNRFSRAVLRQYFRLFHRFDVTGVEGLDTRGPLLVLTGHVSLMDVPAYGVADPFPKTTFLVKASLTRVPLVSHILESWNVIPVDRDGEDVGALRDVLRLLRQGEVVAIAAEGTRNRQGGIGQVNPVLARLAVSADVPLLACAAIGTFEALPPGAWIPRPTRIRVAIGKRFSLHHLRALPKSEGTRRAQHEIRQKILELMPPSQRSIVSV